MRASIVMAAYDAERFIGEAVRSVLAQTHTDWELIVVDDGSHDATVTVVEGFNDERIRVLRESHRGVLGQVRNTGVGAATGDVVAWLDADDVWLETKLALQVDRFSARPDVGVVHTGADLLVGAERRAFPKPPSGPLLAALVENNFIVSSSAAVRKSVLDEYGAFDPDPELRGSPDYELWLRLAPQVSFDFVPERVVLYRVHDGQMTSQLREMSLGGLVALDKHGGTLEIPLRRTGILASIAGDRRRARRELARAVRRRPWDVRAWRWLVRALYSGASVP